MLIVNADDWGKNVASTDNALSCFLNRRISSATAMMFMEDSERSSELALENGLSVGLHLNLTQRFDGRVNSARLLECQRRTSRFLLKNRYALLLYNPLLKNDFEYLYKAQYDMFLELYGKAPTHIDGHRHMHLSANMLLANLEPLHTKKRKSFSFSAGEKSVLNRWYRNAVDLWLQRRYVCTDFFFSIAPISDPDRLRRIIDLSRSFNVELMVHPEKPEELRFLMEDGYRDLIDGVKMAAYQDL